MQAYYASINLRNGLLEGLALVTADTLHFQRADTGVWTAIPAHLHSQVQLNGNLPLADAQRLADGNLFQKACGF